MGSGAADERPTAAGAIPHLEAILDHGGHEMASLPIPDELMVEIFLRLPTPADLARASAACVSFRLVVADRAFLRRYRKLHAPPLLGFLELQCRVFHPAIPPHPSAPEASAAALAADFSFSFLPAPTSDWCVQDIRDGRILLDRPPQTFRELVVCDPLHRRYLLLPPIPAHLTATVAWPDHRCCETFLAPPGSDGNEQSLAEETTFSVVRMSHCRSKLAAFVFSSSTGQWRSISSQSWSDLLPGVLSATSSPLFYSRQYAYGCFYWVIDSMDKWVVLDTQRMEFSIAEFPSDAIGFDGVNIAIVEAGEGRLGVFVRPHYGNYLNYTIRRNSCGPCGSSNQWQFEKRISLDCRYLFVGSTGRHLFLYKYGRPSAWFSLDVKTFQLEKVFVSDSCMPYGHTYSNFPPSLLSTPTISGGKLSVAFWLIPFLHIYPFHIACLI